MTSAAVSDDGKRAGGMGAILLTVFLDLVGFSIIFPLFPAMLEHYLAREGRAGLLGAVLDGATALAPEGAAGFQTVVLFGGVLGGLYSFLQFLAAPLWGAISDRIGRRPVLLLTIGGITLSYLLWFFAGTFFVLVVARVLGGMMAGNLSVATAAVADSTDERSRAKGMGLLGAAFGVGFIVGPALGSLLSFVRVDELLPGVPGVNPFSGAALAAMSLSLGNFFWVLARFPETQPSSREKAVQRPINPVKLFAPSDIPGVGRTNLVYFLFITAFAGMEFTLTFLAHDRFHYTPAKNGVMFIFVGVVLAAVQGGVVRRLAPRVGERRLATLGLALLIPALVVIGAAAVEPLLYLGLFLLAAGSALTTPSLTALTSLYAPRERQGEVLGVFRSLGSLGRALAPLVAASLYWRFGSALPYYAGAALLVLPLALLSTLPERAQIPKR